MMSGTFQSAMSVRISRLGTTRRHEFKRGGRLPEFSQTDQGKKRQRNQKGRRKKRDRTEQVSGKQPGAEERGVLVRKEESSFNISCSPVSAISRRCYSRELASTQILQFHQG